MDLNVSPLPEDDEQSYEEYAEDVQLQEPSESVQTMLREREERRRRMKRENRDEGPKHVSQPSMNEHVQNKTSRGYGRVRQLPQGWLDCPSHGHPIGYLIPSKVPLDESYNDLVAPGKRYSSKQVINSLRRNQRELGLVIDLTNTTRYYSPSEWTKLGIKHIKIRCKGRDAVPDNESVNTFVYEVMQFLTRHRHSKKYILVHCTHGHNRTGYMIVNFLMRSPPMHVAEAIHIFAQKRPPGIYKRDYIEALYTFYHEHPENLICPPTPEWKRSSELDLNGEAVPEEDDDGNTEALLHDHVENKLITNDDVLGDPIPYDQQDALRLCCYQFFELTPSGRGNVQFPGSHPVSLNRDNLQLLRQRYYYATWKADGTRYMMLITTHGCYLIDRNFCFRRIQMRFPMKNVNEGFHQFTLLDGEMIIDKVPESGLKRRYLIYDLVAIGSRSVVKLPFSERWKLLEEEVVRPRTNERRLFECEGKCNPIYRYDMEPFAVRQKGFWLLSTVTKLLKGFIPNLSHEADGLIFQGWVRTPKSQTRIRYRRPSQLRIRSSHDIIFKTLIPSNPIDLIPPILTIASGAALYLIRNRFSGPSPEPVAADWLLCTSPTPFNRFVLLRCPSISFEGGDEGERLLREERHYVNSSRGRILAKDGRSEECEELGYQRVCVMTDDGGVISLDWPENLDLEREYGLDTTVLIVPGTTEGSMDRDVKKFVVDALRSGCFPVVMNPRGCAGSPLMTARLFTAADSDDICTAIKYIIRLRPWTTLMGVGVGYGANMLTKYLAEVGESTPLTAAVCIDNPFDLEEATRSLPHQIAMDQKLTGGLIDILRANKVLFQGKTKGFDLAKALSATSVRDFDQAVSMISCGFDTIEDFYSMISTRELVKKLNIPVLFIQSDDGTVPLYSVPRNAIADNPFTSLLLCTCHSAVVSRFERAAILWCQQLTIQWLSAVELALLKGMHPLLKDVDITVNPSKGLSFIKGEASEDTIAAKNRTRGIYDNSSHRTAGNEALLEMTSSNTANGFLINVFSNERDGTAHDISNINTKSESALGRMQKGDIRIKENEKRSASHVSSTTGVDTPTDNKESQVLQTAAVVMNMLDVTMPGTLDDEKKKKVLAAIEHGDTLMKALEGAVPAEVCGKLTTAVTEIMRTQSANLNFGGLSRIGWIHDVTSGKSRNQERSEDSSATESGQGDARPSDQMKNGIESDVKAQEGAESAPGSAEASQEKIVQASANVEDVNKEGYKPSNPDKLEEASGRIYESAGEEFKVNQSSGKGDGHSADKQVLNGENDFQNIETKTVDALNIPISSAISDETLSAGSTNHEQNVEENKSDIQMNENKITRDVGDQYVQGSTKPEEHEPQHFSSKIDPIPVTQALDALTGFDDSTQMAVNSVFGVIENMIDQFENASNKENIDEINNNENHELVKKSEKAGNINNKPDVEPDENEPSNHPENNLEEDAISNEDFQGNMKKVSHGITSSINNSICRGKENNTAYKNLDTGYLNNGMQKFPLDVAGKKYCESPSAAYPHRYSTTQLPAMKSADLESTTDLFLDPEEGRWRIMDQSGYTKSNQSSSGENRSINGRDQNTLGNDTDNIIEPSYVILDNEFSKFECGSAEKHDAADEKHNGNISELLIKNTLMCALKVEVGRKLGKPDLEDVESSLESDLEQFAHTVSRAVVHDHGLNLDSLSKSDNTCSIKFGTIEEKHMVKTISSAALDASHLRKVLPIGVIIGSSLASLRQYFQVVSGHIDDQSEAIHKSRNIQENYYGQESETKKGYFDNDKDHQIDSDNTIDKGPQVLQIENLKSGGIMVGAVTAALGVSALSALEQKAPVSFNEKGSSKGEAKIEEVMQETNTNSFVGSLAEKAMSVAGTVVPTKSGGEVDQERLVTVLAELGQKGGILRFVGKFALLWGGIRGAMSLTDRLISFFHFSKRPLSHRVLGFVCMALVLWTPVVIPFLPTIVQCWTTNTSNSIVTYACIAGLYVAITILVMLWGKRIRGFENPLQQYGLEFTSVSRVHDLFKGFVGGTMTVLCVHSINALLGYARLSLGGLPSPAGGFLAMIGAYGNMMLLTIPGAMTAIGIATVEELLFRSWLPEEVAADLGYYKSILIAGLAFSLTQRSLSSIPGFLLLSLALFGMKQRAQGSLAVPIGMRAGIMITNSMLQTGGFLTYRTSAPFWLTNRHPWHPFDGIVGICFCAILAIFFYPKPPRRKEMIAEVGTSVE